MTEGTSAPIMIAKSSQSGPTERLLGNAAYTNPAAIIAMIASQRGSLRPSNLVLLVTPRSPLFTLYVTDPPRSAYIALHSPWIRNTIPSINSLVYARARGAARSVSYTHLRAHETPEHLVCRLL